MSSELHPGLHALIGCALRYSELGVNELQNRAELAHERRLEAYYGGDHPQTDRERCEVLARQGVR
jgi:hypothetical protein